MEFTVAVMPTMELAHFDMVVASKNSPLQGRTQIQFRVQPNGPIFTKGIMFESVHKNAKKLCFNAMQRQAMGLKVGEQVTIVN